MNIISWSINKYATNNALNANRRQSLTQSQRRAAVCVSATVSGNF
ncbi:MAG: hypothetical protein WAS72_11785 [Saprospiraceae bacterium]